MFCWYFLVMTQGIDDNDKAEFGLKIIC